MMGFGHLFASIMAPIQWLVLAAVAGAVLAPRFIPPVARTVGRCISRMNRRKRIVPVSKAIKPCPAEIISEKPDDPRMLWSLGLIVGLLAAVLSWLILRSR